MKLRSRLALMALLALVPLLIFSTLAARRLSDGTRENAIRAMQETANATALIIDRELQGALSAVTVLSKSPFLIDGKFEQFYLQAKSTMSGASGWVILYSSDGKQLLNTRLPYGAPLLVRPVPDELTPVISQNEIHISGMTWSRALKKHIIFIDVPVQTADGRRFVLSQAVYSDHFALAFQERNIPASWVVGIFDKTGVTIGRSVKANEFVGKRANPDTLKAIQSGTDTTLKHIIRGNVEVYDVITHSDLSGWAVAVGVPVDEIDQQVREAVYLAAGGLLIAIAAALIGAGVVGNRLASSIEAAAAASEKLGKGEDLPVMKPGAAREINNLQDALVNAAEKLKAAELRRASAESRNVELLESERAARQKAEVESKRKDEFLAMLGHELRNPLSAITSAVSLLKLRVRGDPAILRPTDVIHRQSEHLRVLLNDILDLSRVIYGKVQLDQQAADLGLVIEESVNSMMSSTRLSRHVFSFSTESLPVWIDRTRIEQVFSNLIDNAVKYTDEGGSIKVSVSRENDQALIRIADSGVGIGHELLPYVFDVFVQGDNTLARTAGGMGIGLSLVQELVHLHDGTVQAFSDGPGAGSVFEVRLPLLHEHAQEPGNLDADSRSRLLTSDLTILLVEDQEELREIHQALLTELGLEVLTAANGKEAIDIATARKPNVALIDVGLPDISGYEVAADLRANPETSSIHLLALTGYGLKEDKARAQAAGFDLHLTKPLPLDELRKYLATVVS